VNAAVGTAHGRVNVIGEHTDYNEGWVLPTAIPMGVRVEATARPDRRVRVRSAACGEDEYELGRERPGRGWLDYVQGLTAALAARGVRLGGCDLAVTSDVPMGAGLASSAALTVAVLRALAALAGFELDPLEGARIAQASENDFAGAKVGIMDPLAALLAHEGRALLVDTRSLATRELPLPSEAELVVLDSGVRHSHSGGAYNRRREECAAACATLGIRSLRDVPADFASRLPPLLVRRVRHVTGENARVLAAVRALETDDPATLGALLAGSHRSLRDDYEVSVPALDRIVAAAEHDDAVFGGRMTGGGFGGAALLLVRRGEGAAAARRVLARVGDPGMRVLLPAA
jgi:galactokinase